MDLDFLKKVRAQDKEQAATFSEELPYYYAEIASLLLHECEDSVSHFQ